MIQPNELRIGNLIEYKGQHVPILKIDSMNKLVDAGKLIYKGSVTVPEYSPPSYRGRIWNYNAPWCEQIKPVSLTEEWLIKFGFIDHETFWSNTWGTNGVVIITYSQVYKCFMYQLAQSVDKSIFTVHQLQNLYFALTGEELTISEPTKQSEG